MIKIKLVNLPAILNVFNSMATQNLPVMISYRMNKIMRKLQEEGTGFNEILNNLRAKYGQKDENGQLKLTEEGGLFVDESVRESYDQEFKEFTNIECELDCQKIFFSALDGAGIVMSPVDLSIIEDFIDFDI